MSSAWVYLETTMFNFFYGPETTPEYRQYKADTGAVFYLIDTGNLEPFSSDYVLTELLREKDEYHRDKMIALLQRHNVKMLPRNDEVDRLAQVYLPKKVIPPSCLDDARHIAATTVNGLDFIVSLNFQHIVREWTINKVAQINADEGYRQIGLFKPQEVLQIENAR
jgi:hypothetical protein